MQSKDHLLRMFKKTFDEAQIINHDTGYGITITKDNYNEIMNQYALVMPECTKCNGTNIDQQYAGNDGVTFKCNECKYSWFIKKITNSENI